MPNRRQFIKVLGVAGAGALAMPLKAMGQYQKLTILHTNDLHCHFEPFDENDPKYGGKGGMNRIAAYVKKMRQIDPNLILLDCGDFSQGTPYYNFFKGEVVMRLMSEMGYDAVTIGNHEFDNGIENIKRISGFASFPMVSSNYDFSNTALKGVVKQNLILERNNLRIGIYGLGIELEGLVSSSLCENTIYKEPLQEALKQEDYLKNDQKCDLVICLSHLGYQYKKSKISDVIIGQETRFTDAILGGHTHTFLEQPNEVLNAEKQPVVINQVGWAALMLGQLDFFFERQKKTILNFSNKQVG